MSLGAIFVWLCMLALTQVIADFVQDCVGRDHPFAWCRAVCAQYVMCVILLMLDKPSLGEALGNAAFLTYVIRLVAFCRRQPKT